LQKTGNIIINTVGVIENECIVNDAGHLARGTVLTSNVRVRGRRFIGANAIIKQGIIINEDAIISAASFMVQNITDKETWIGNLAKKIS
jgi:acetyltransferase-like isoleucine patch superfamily enzyme